MVYDIIWIRYWVFGLWIDQFGRFWIEKLTSCTREGQVSHSMQTIVQSTLLSFSFSVCLYLYVQLYRGLPILVSLFVQSIQLFPSLCLQFSLSSSSSFSSFSISSSVCLLTHRLVLVSHIKYFHIPYSTTKISMTNLIECIRPTATTTTIVIFIVKCLHHWMKHFFFLFKTKLVAKCVACVSLPLPVFHWRR